MAGEDQAFSGADPVTMYFPDGKFRDVPPEDVKDVSSQGAQIAFKMKGQDGTVRHVPASDVPAIVKSGKATVVPLESQHAEIPKYYGFTPGNVAKALWQGGSGLVKGIYDVGADTSETLARKAGVEDKNPTEGTAGFADLYNKYIGNPAGEAAKKATKSFKEGHYSEAVGHELSGAIPVIGPFAEHLGERAGSGDVGGATGEAAGMALVGGAADRVAAEAEPLIPTGSDLRSISRSAAHKVYEKALKPSTTLAPEERAALVKTGLEEGIPISPEGAQHINAALADLHDSVKASIKSKDEGGEGIPPGRVAARVKDVRSRFETQAAPTTDLNAIDAVTDDFMDQFRAKDAEGKPIPGSAVKNIDPVRAQEIKKGTYESIGERSFDDQKGARVEAEKGIARGLKEEIAQQFPEVAPMNEKMGELYDLQPYIQRRLAQMGNKEIMSLTKGVVTGGGAMLGGLFGGTEGAAMGGTAALVLDHFMRDPKFQSRLAIALNKFGKIPKAEAAERVSRYAGLLSMLKQRLKDAATGESGELDLSNPWKNLKYDKAATDQALHEQASGKLEAGKTVVQRAQEIKQELMERDKIGTQEGAVDKEETVPKNEPEKPDAPTFFSKSIRLADEKLPDKFSGDQALATLRNAGAKEGELSWMGVPEFLKGKAKVSKADLLGFMRENEIKLGETELKTLPDDPTNDQGAERAALKPPKYQGYALPGPKENYREMLLTLNGGKAMAENKPITEYGFTRRHMTRSDFEAMYGDPDSYDDVKPGFMYSKSGDLGPGGYHILTTTDGKYRVPEPGGENEFDTLAEAEKHLTGVVKDIAGSEELGDSSEAFKSGHFDEPNILAHARLSDRVMADGKKALLAEEVQSDWHQQGKKEGYKTAMPAGLKEKAQAALDKVSDHLEGVIPANMKQHFTRLSAGSLNFPGYMEGSDLYKWEQRGVITKAEAEAVDKYMGLTKAANSGVPDAPFKSDWHELVMKRLMREAAEKGYDRLAWVTGDQTAERYDLSKQVSRVHYFPEAGGGLLSAYDFDGKPVISKNGVKPDQLADYIGKEPAKKIMDSKPVGKQGEPDMRVLEGADLKVGGEWAKRLYDQAIPNFVNKYAKKWGAKVVDRDLNNASPKRELEVEEHPEPELGYVIVDYSTPQDPQYLHSKKDFVSMDDDAFGEDLTTFRSHARAVQYLRDHGHEWQAKPVNKVHTIDITPQMRKSLMKEGQPIASGKSFKTTGGEEVA